MAAPALFTNSFPGEIVIKALRTLVALAGLGACAGSGGACVSFHHLSYFFCLIDHVSAVILVEVFGYFGHLLRFEGFRFPLRLEGVRAIGQLIKGSRVSDRWLVWVCLVLADNI